VRVFYARMNEPTSESTAGIAGRELTLSRCLEELKKLDLPLKPQHANRRDEVLWEVAKRLERHVVVRHAYAETFEEPAKIRAWLPDGKNQKKAESLARAFDRPSRHMLSDGLEDTFAAGGLTSPSEFARQTRKAATLMRFHAERAQKVRAAKAARRQERIQKGERLRPPPQRKLPNQLRFAKMVLELSEYFDVPTGLHWVSDDSEEAKSKRTGPIVEFGAALAAICGVQAPSGAVYDQAKREIAREAAATPGECEIVSGKK
jgi:hypothetical protein